jgi:transposase-like protein
MKDTARKTARRQEATTQLAFAAMLDARATLHDAIVSAGMGVLSAMLEEERVKLCGPRYAHQPERSATRAGHTAGELSFGGRRVGVRRPRVRSVDGDEVTLETWEQFAEADPLTPRAVEQMVLGVSTRKYVRSIEAAPPGLKTRGTSKSAVSRRFVAATREKFQEMMSRDLGDLKLCSIMIDGIHVDEHLVLVALGIDENADKHISASTKAHRRTRRCARVCSRISRRVASTPIARCSSSSTGVRRSRRRSARSSEHVPSFSAARSTRSATSRTISPKR